MDFEGEDNSSFYEWLNRTSDQTYDNYQIALYMNDVTDEMYEAARRVAFVNRVTTGRPMDGRRHKREEDARSRNEMPYQRYAEVRNGLVNWIVETATEAKYFFSIDSDVLIRDNAIERCVMIMEKHPDIAMLGIPVNNSRQRNKKHPLGLFMGSAQYSFGYAGMFLPDKPELTGYNSSRGFSETQIFDVDFVGACVMIRMDILRPPLSIRYGPHRQGEDCFFCHAVKNAGLRMSVDPSQVTLHMMDPGLLQHDMLYYVDNKHI
jgi:hypothetical protein